MKSLKEQFDAIQKVIKGRDHIAFTCDGTKKEQKTYAEREEAFTGLLRDAATTIKALELFQDRKQLATALDNLFRNGRNMHRDEYEGFIVDDVIDWLETWGLLQPMITRDADAPDKVILVAKRTNQRVEYCEYCDGCVWYEGGKTLKTTCGHCAGTGIKPTLAAKTEKPKSKRRGKNRN